MRMSIGVRRWHFRAGWWRLSSFPRRTAGGERGRQAKRGRARFRRVAVGSVVLECGSVSMRLSLCVSASLSLYSLSPTLSVPAVVPGASWAWGVRECVRRRETELGVPVCVRGCVRGCVSEPVPRGMGGPCRR